MEMDRGLGNAREFQVRVGIVRDGMVHLELEVS